MVLPVYSQRGGARTDLRRSPSEDVDSYLRSGMNDVLVKPFTKHGLFDILGKHLIHFEAIQPSAEVPRSLGLSPLPNQDIVDAGAIEAAQLINKDGLRNRPAAMDWSDETYQLVFQVSEGVLCLRLLYCSFALVCRPTSRRGNGGKCRCRRFTSAIIGHGHLARCVRHASERQVDQRRATAGRWRRQRQRCADPSPSKRQFEFIQCPDPSVADASTGSSRSSTITTTNRWLGHSDGHQRPVRGQLRVHQDEGGGQEGARGCGGLVVKRRVRR
jgi:hypothetical protein